MKSKIIIPVLLCLSMVSCKTLYQTANCVYLSGDSKVLTLRSDGYGDTKKEALNNAEWRAFEQLLFRGIPEYHQNSPLVDIDEVSAKTKYPKYFEEFETAGRYKMFIISSVVVAEPRLNRNSQYRYRTTIDVKINFQALRLDLERSGIVRKFGF